jgi:multidrug efflux system membrane fusion protein
MLSAQDPPRALPPEPALSPASPRNRVIGLVVIVVAVGGLITAGVMPRLARRQALDVRQAVSNQPPRVAVVQVKRGAVSSDLVLPGTALPAQNAVVYARLDGFVDKLLVDLGDEVKEGQLLAVLQAPELEAELARARSRQGEAERNLTLSRTSAERHARLATTGISSREAADEAQARANSAEAALDGGNAENNRLSAVYAYRRVLAPFAGIITRRGVDRGTLVKSSATALFEIAQTRTLKIFVDVPQTLAADIRPGLSAQVFTPEAPDRRFAGKVVRTARALDPSTRTLRTEIHLPGEGGLLAGSYVRVKLTVGRSSAPVVIPAAALVTRKEGQRVLVLGAGNAVQPRTVVTGRDLGEEIEVLDGLTGNERVVLSPPDDLQAGAKVSVAEGRRAP